MRDYFKTFTLFFFFISLNGAMAQNCGTCTMIVAGNDSLAYTVNSGQTLCMDSLSQFTGTVTLNGGTICNKGLFNPAAINLTSGSIINYSRFLVSGSLILSDNLILTNGSNAVITVRGTLTVNGGSFNNTGITNIKDNIIFTNGTFSNSAIVNCKIISGANITNIVNSGILNKE